MTTKFDPYQAITDQVITLLENGTAPWRKPWDPTLGLPRSLTTGKVYRGINPFLLHMSAVASGYTSPFWGTYKAIAERGGQVRKGEHGTMIMFWKSYLDRVELDAKGNPKRRFVLRTYKVFNTEQADDAEGQTFAVPTLPERTEHDPLAACETIVAGYLASGPSVSFGSTMAAYSPSADHIELPDRAAFATTEEFYSTYFHELTHSTGHTSRLNREGVTSGTHFGDAVYSKEELVAEMGASFLAGLAGIAPATLDNSASYLASWIGVLKGDNRLVVGAAAQAQRAADLIQGVAFAEEEEVSHAA